MTSDEIRDRFLNYFVERDHYLLGSAALVPAQFDPSVLLTTAGMHPLKPYFMDLEQPPSKRLTSCQKCFRTSDIDTVGTTKRHLTFFEMLGNFSVGDYFKQGAIEYAWDLSINGFGLDPNRIWITVFEGDDELSLGPDEEAIAAWESVGVPRERIVFCARSENFWQAGATGPCGPCSELYFDRGLEYGSADDLPGQDNERFLEYWNLVFMEYDQIEPNSLTPLPSKNIDTGLGLNRLAAILQGVDSVFETDQFRPLIELGEKLSAKRYGETFEVDRALRILSDHSRGTVFLLADGVVPSNEDRGYVLRRLMRRAIVQGRRIGIEGEFLTKFAKVVRDLMQNAYPELREHAQTIDMWMANEEEAFGKTMQQGTRLLNDHIEHAKRNNEEGIGAAEAFALHDTYGFPFELTLELAAEHDLGVDAQGFEDLMDQQRARARASAGRGGHDKVRQGIHDFVHQVDPATKFVGYNTLQQTTQITAIGEVEGKVVAKLTESPFYATGGGQVHDEGVIESSEGGCTARVVDVVRVGDDQAVIVDIKQGELDKTKPFVARVDSRKRHATACNHTATHLLHAALREVVGEHARQAGSYVGPDKLRFDFAHGQALTTEQLTEIENRVNDWISASEPVTAVTTTLENAKRSGAMALFGESYGEVVRMVEIGGGSRSRELCGGTHVEITSQIGAFAILSESSSAANVRRIEAVSGPAALALLRKHDRALGEIARSLRPNRE
jgi:alanyl-tRNA synthetase